MATQLRTTWRRGSSSTVTKSFKPDAKLPAQMANLPMNSCSVISKRAEFNGNRPRSNVKQLKVSISLFASDNLICDEELAVYFKC